MKQRFGEKDIRLVGDTYACTKVASYETNEARTTTKLKHVLTLKSGTTLGNVACQDLQTTHVGRQAKTMMIKRAKRLAAISDIRNRYGE